MTPQQLDLNRHWTDELVQLPESGMGYQRVRVRLKSGGVIEDALVFNATVLQVPAGAPVLNAEDIAGIELANDNGA